MEKGRLIVIEGACDGIGKTTQFKLLEERLKKDNEDVVVHHFPSYGTYQGVPVEKYLEGEFGKPSELSPYFVNSLYAVDRAITWNTKLKENYENGKVILLDRYTTSSLIYQSALLSEEDKKIFIDRICNFEYDQLGIAKPDKVIFLHAPFDLVDKLRRQRRENEGIVNDIHERDVKFMKNVYDSAVFIANYLNWDKIECSNGEEMRAISDIHEDVYKLVKKR